jgi:hypothetical protein
MKYFAKFKQKDFQTLLVLIAVIFGWLLIDQFILHQVYQRIIALIVILTVLFFIQFKINKPARPYYYANTIVLITCSFLILVSLVVHLVISNDFSYRLIIMWLLTATMPYLAAYLYSKFS